MFVLVLQIGMVVSVWGLLLTYVAEWLLGPDDQNYNYRLLYFVIPEVKMPSCLMATISLMSVFSSF